MRTRSGQELDPLSPLPPSNVRPPPARQRRTGPPPPPPPLPPGVRPVPHQPQQQQQTRTAATAAAAAVPPRRNETPSSARQPEQAQPAAAAATAAATDNHQEQPPARNWVLTLQIRSEHGKPITKVGVQVTEHMNAAGLAACLAQAFASVSASRSTPTAPIAGLFIERNGLFVSLDHLLATPSLRQHTFGLTYCPPPPQPPPPLPWYQEPWVMAALAGPLVLAILYFVLKRFGPQMGHAILWMFQALFDATVQLPLQELYRYGPWFIGWEGASLPSICARITYYGDADFWRRNYQECADIFANKEESFLRVARPTVYAIIILILLWLLAQLLQHFRQVARYRHAQAVNMAPPPEMVDTYRALQVLLRQVRKGLVEPEPTAGRRRGEPVVNNNNNNTRPRNFR